MYIHVYVFQMFKVIISYRGSTLYERHFKDSLCMYYMLVFRRSFRLGHLRYSNLQYEQYEITMHCCIIVYGPYVLK